ncbi:MAG: 3-deoxy-7-phosphoheptulonate synthase [Deltaproteobacteria bacterium]|nr:3-deoxy-7-phosphoheptulonate synthase [Deltaproteobacteria bacterium]
MPTQRNTDDLRIAEVRPLIPPAILIEELPVDPAAAQTIADARDAARAIIVAKEGGAKEGAASEGAADDRLLVVVGPCSIHDPAAALEYASRLKPVAERLSRELLVVMRVYFEKPRTTVGWKGLINDPRLDGSFAINAGLRIARKLLLDLADLGVPAAGEFLDTITPQFIADLIAWGAIGARTTESQVHRELASGLSMPVGFKNGTDGGVQIAIDAIRAARGSHHFLSVTKQGISAIVATKGNDACHVILRGGKDGPNFDAASVAAVERGLIAAGLAPRVMIDCSHGNTGKDYRRQPEVARDVAAQIAAGSRAIMGVMIESHLVEGRQDARPGETLRYGQSITDGCIGWEQTVPVLDELAAAVARRRG